ncbi:MAG: HAMP domain-containing sensor histidine kinase [Chloroflexota bacterium]
MDTLIYASVPILIGFGLVCFVVGLVVSSIYWQRAYKKLEATQESSANFDRNIIISEVIRDLKHQLGNYLNIIKHRLAVMRGEIDHLPADQRDLWSQRLVYSLDNLGYYEWRMTQLIENLDFLTRLENPDTILPFSEVKPDAIVDDVVHDLNDRAKARRVELSWWARPELFPRITANHDALRQALINVIDNGIKYAAPEEGKPDKGEIDIELQSHDNNTITIRISDNGPGIPADDLPRLFDKGYTTERARGRRPKEGGMGFGLYIVKTVVEKHQGWAKIESRVGDGTTITLTLPIRRL